MKYRNKQHNQMRNEMLRNAGLLGLALGVGALAQILVKTDSAAAAVACLAAVLGTLGLSSLKSIRE